MLNYLKIYNLGWRKEESQGKGAAWGQPEFVQIISLPNTMDAHHASLGRRTVTLLIPSLSSFLNFNNPLFFCLIIPSNLSWKRFVKREQLRDWSKLLLDQISPNLPFTMVRTISLSLSLIIKLKFLTFFFCAQILLEWKNRRAEIDSQR